jgi:hypothetical protein
MANKLGLDIGIAISMNTAGGKETWRTSSMRG